MKKVLFWGLICLTVMTGRYSFAAESAATSEISLNETASTLNHLIERSNDATEGYRQAAEEVKSPELKVQFASESAKRAQFVQELQAKISELGKGFEKGGSFEGAVHRGWIEVKTALTKKDDNAVLGAVKTGESAALKAYQDALNKDLPEDIKQMVQNQADEIQSAFNRVDKKLEMIKQQEKK